MSASDGAVERVGLVLSGAAARGPYQAGALAVLIPALLAEGRWPVIILGTSSGALNAALLAQFAQEGAQAGERVVQTWLDVGSPFRNAWLTTPCKALQLGLRAVGLSVVPPVTSLLDTQPLRHYAEQTFDPAALTSNVRPGLVEAIGVAATWCPPAQAAARTRLFVQSIDDHPLATPPGVDVVRTPLRVEHLLASAAIPVVFPPVRIDQPPNYVGPDYQGQYIDGGVRLNTPIQAALALGATRLVVVSGHSVGTDPAQAGVGPPPDLAASTAVTIRAVLTDGLSDDLAALHARNSAARDPADQVPYRVVAPLDGELAALAAMYLRPHWWRPLDSYALIGRLLAAAGEGIGPDELLSLLFFDTDYFTAQIGLARAHAKIALEQDWQV